MVLVTPAPSVPSEHGKAVVQSPLFETKVMFAGVGSFTITFAAADGPALFTVMVKATFWPTAPVVGPVLVTETSASSMKVEALAVLFALLLSVAVVAAVAVLVMVVPAPPVTV